MKLWHCDWVPTSVANWLCGELEKQGIPGTIYTHTLFSLLHPYFCPHPLPESTSTQSVKQIVELGGLHNINNLEDIEELIDELNGPVHPDADFPDLEVPQPCSEGSRRSKKRHKKKLQQLYSSPEKAWKVAALQCLLPAKDETHPLKCLIDELFTRLDNECGEALNDSNDKLEIKEQANNFTIKALPIKIVDSKPEAAHSKNFDFPPLRTKEAAKITSLSSTPLNPISKDPIQEEEKDRNVPEQDSLPARNDLKSLSLQKNLSKQTNLEMELNFGVQNDSFRNQMASDNHNDEEGAYFATQIPIKGDNADDELRQGVMSVDNSLMQNVEEETGRSIDSKLEEWECAELLGGSLQKETAADDDRRNRLFERSNAPWNEGIFLTNATVMDQEDNSRRSFSMPREGESYQRILDPSIRGKEPWEEDVEPSWQDNQKEPWPDRAGPWQIRNHKEPWENDFSPIVWNSVDGGQPRESLPDISAGGICSFGPTHAADLIPPDHGQMPTQPNWENFSPQIDGSIEPREDIWKESEPWQSLPVAEPLFKGNIISRPQGRNRNRDCTVAVNNSSRDKQAKSDWSDFNDNFDLVPPTSGEAKGSISTRPFNVEEKSLPSKEICESFKQLNLEQLWCNNMPSKQMLDGLPDEEHLNLIPGNLNNLSQESRDTVKQKANVDTEISELFMPSIPSGPIGPCAVLKHTESSGFSTVVPHRNVSSAQNPLIDLNSTKDGKADDLKDFSILSQGEENLLTSPRTHFKPIRQDSYGSFPDDAKSEDGQGVGALQNPDVVFQRTGSGNLFLEVDILDGSPKKYMVYKEPAKIPPKIEITDIRENPPVSEAFPSESPIPFVPKFKLVNNEKFSQTEQEKDQPIFREGFSASDFISTQNKEGRELKFQNILEGHVKYLWKGESPPEGMESIWEKTHAARMKKKEAWELECNSGLPLDKYSSLLNEDQPKWSQEDHFQPSIDKLSRNLISFSNQLDSVNPDSGDGVEGSFSKVKFLWQKSEGKHEPSIGKFTTNLKELESTSALWDSHPYHSSKDLINNATDTESQNPWNIEALSQYKNLQNNGSKAGKDNSDPQSRWQLQWEVDQEADEILGGLMPSSPLKSPQNGTGDPFDLFEDQPCPVEDLDHLEPEWDLNDGFEWDPTTEEDIDGDESGQELLLYETEDGQTVFVPVEYLDDSLYDQIFGSNAETPIGGSLPALSQGQLEQWKSGKVSYKISRRARGGRLQPPSRRPCSYFLEGNCRRSDCKFSHDLSSITCRFWEEGTCLKGVTCPFLHGHDPPPRRRNRSEGDQAPLSEALNVTKLKEKTTSGAGGATKSRNIPKTSKVSTMSSSSFEIDSETDFPSLSSSLESKTSCLDDIMPSSSSKPRVTKLSKKKQKFIAVPKTLLKEIGNKQELVVTHSKLTKSQQRRRSKHATANAEGSSDGQEEAEKRSDCLRKLLKKHQYLPKTFSHDDGTLSDF